MPHIFKSVQHHVISILESQLHLHAFWAKYFHECLSNIFEILTNVRGNEKQRDKHNAELQRADLGTKDMG